MVFLHDLVPEYNFVAVHSKAEKAAEPGGGRARVGGG